MSAPPPPLRRFLGGSSGHQFLRRAMLVADEDRPVLRGNAIALRPRPDGEDRRACENGGVRLPHGSDDFGMSTHSVIMHNASRSAIPHLHNRMHYARCMTSPADRLRIARLRAGFKTGKEAAEAMGFPVSTYLAHENGSRGYPAPKAATYARKFKVREQWLLYGVGPAPGENGGEAAEVADLVERLPPLRRAEALRILRVLAGNEGA